MDEKNKKQNADDELTDQDLDQFHQGLDETIGAFKKVVDTLKAF